VQLFFLANPRVGNMPLAKLPSDLLVNVAHLKAFEVGVVAHS
jgi:hypothetical protein